MERAFFLLCVPPDAQPIGKYEVAPLDRPANEVSPLRECDEEASSATAGLLTKIVGTSRSATWKIVGGLSRPSKMPCYAWGIPAQACQVGNKLTSVQNSVCAKCYAFKGYFRTHRVRDAYQRRLDRFDDPEWGTAMIRLIYWQVAETGEPYFRWFDSGDLQGVEMLRHIATVAKGTPEIRHWLPTREYRIVREYLRTEKPPENLVIRVSAPLIDGVAPKIGNLPTSTVHSSSASAVVQGFSCPAYSGDQPYCGDCRACWDGEVENVSYPLH